VGVPGGPKQLVFGASASLAECFWGWLQDFLLASAAVGPHSAKSAPGLPKACEVPSSQARVCTPRKRPCRGHRIWPFRGAFAVLWWLRATKSEGLRVCTYNSNPIAHPNLFSHLGSSRPKAFAQSLHNGSVESPFFESSGGLIGEYLAVAKHGEAPEGADLDAAQDPLRSTQRRIIRQVGETPLFAA
jgi:hypothetical protein